MEDCAACSHDGNEKTIEHVLCRCPHYREYRLLLAAMLAGLEVRPLWIRQP